MYHLFRALLRPLLCVLFLSPTFAGAGKAHRHGVAEMQLAVEQTQVVVAMEIPLDSLVGYERAPRNEAERRAAADALVKMKEAGSLFKFDAAAACRAKEATVEAPVLEGKAASGKNDEHAQLDATFVFVCGDPAKITRLEVNLFDAFKRLDKIEGQSVSAKNQTKFVLTRSSRIFKISGQ